MTEEQKTAFVFSAAVRALIRSQGMMALNVERQNLGQTLAYDEEAFVNLINEEGIDHNTMLSLFHDIV